MKRRPEAVKIGRMIQESRKRRNLSQKEYADRVQLGEQFIKEIEYGYKNPSVPSLFLIFSHVDAPSVHKFLQAVLPPEVAKDVLQPAPLVPSLVEP